jgi:hypothetical protein
VSNIVKAVKDSLDAFKNLGREDNPFTLMASREVSQDQGLNILQSLTNKGTISEVRREGIARVWNDPSHNEDEGRNLYNLLNAVTQFTTHEVADTNFEMSERLNTNVTRLFSKAATDETALTGLWTPKENEVLTITE